MEKFWNTVLIILALSIAPYVCYRMGRHIERKALTYYLVTTLDDECVQCRDIGYHAGYQKCQKEFDDTEAPDAGRY